MSELITFMLGVVFTIWVVGGSVKAGRTGEILIDECQTSLPRDQVCELHAVPVVGVKGDE